ncbi:MAG TPA: hypothetical protein VIK35_04620 [Verrucomicrobiae bacterium]
MKTEINENQTSPVADSPEVTELKAQIEEAETRLLYAHLPAAVSTEMDALVKEKMRAGLSREQAIECARRQIKSASITVERDAVVKTAAAKVEKDFEGKDKRSPEYKEAKAEAVSKALADGKFHERFVAAGSLHLNPA